MPPQAVNPPRAGSGGPLPLAGRAGPILVVGGEELLPDTPPSPPAGRGPGRAASEAVGSEKLGTVPPHPFEAPGSPWRVRPSGVCVHLGLEINAPPAARAESCVIMNAQLAMTRPPAHSCWENPLTNLEDHV